MSKLIISTADEAQAKTDLVAYVKSSNFDITNTILICELRSNIRVYEVKLDKSPLTPRKEGKVMNGKMGQLETELQDVIDNEIQNLLIQLAEVAVDYSDEGMYEKLPWNIAAITSVREAALTALKEEYGIELIYP